MPAKTALPASEHAGVITDTDPVFQAFDAARRQMHCGASMTRTDRDEMFFRAGFSAGKASQIVEVVLGIEGQSKCTA